MLRGFGIAMNATPTSRQLQSLLFCFAVISLIHLMHMPIWVFALCTLIGVWHFGILHRKLPSPSLLILAPLTISIAVGIMVTFGGAIHKYSGLALLVSMIGLKLLETKTRRDFVIVIIAMYLIVGYLFLFSQSLLYFFLSIFAVLILTSTLLQLHVHRPLGWLNANIQAGKLLLMTAPLVVIMFVLFPRAQGPLWSGIQQHQGKLGLPGLSNRIELNQMSQNVQDSRVAFRVQFKQSVPANETLYWRGPVLWTMVGDQWFAADAYERLSQEQIMVSGQAINYTVTLEPNTHDWLLMLDMPIEAPIAGFLTKDYSIQANKKTETRVQYEGISYTDYQLGPTHRLSNHTRRMALQIDEDSNPRTLKMARAWAHLSKPDIVNMGIQFFKQQSFSYNLNPVVAKQDVIDAFLFDTKRGFCEHFATAFVTMMRAAGVPARLVTGYQGGEHNGDYYIIRQSDAHAWAEVWLEGRGWLRIDPTATVAPERIEQGISEAIEQSSETQSNTENQAADVQTPSIPASLRIKQYPNLHRALLVWDNAEHQWNQTIINYNKKQQQTMLGKLSQQPLSANMLFAWLLGLLIMVLGVLAYLFRNKIKRKQHPAQLLYAKYIKSLARYQLLPLATETALDFANRVGQRLPTYKHQAIQIAQMYNMMMYSQLEEYVTTSQLHQFKMMISQFSQATKKADL